MSQEAEFIDKVVDKLNRCQNLGYSIVAQIQDYVNLYVDKISQSQLAYPEGVTMSGVHVSNR